MSLNFNLLRAAARAVSRSNKDNYRWLLRQYKEHVGVKNIYDCHRERHRILYYERLFQALEIVPAHFLIENCGILDEHIFSRKWLYKSYKIATPAYSRWNFKNFIITDSTIEHEIYNRRFEREAYEWLMEYLLKIKQNP